MANGYMFGQPDLADQISVLSENFIGAAFLGESVYGADNFCFTNVGGIAEAKVTMDVEIESFVYAVSSGSEVTATLSLAVWNGPDSVDEVKYNEVTRKTSEPGTVATKKTTIRLNAGDEMTIRKNVSGDTTNAGFYFVTLLKVIRVL